LTIALLPGLPFGSKRWLRRATTTAGADRDLRWLIEGSTLALTPRNERDQPSDPRDALPESARLRELCHKTRAHQPPLITSIQISDSTGNTNAQNKHRATPRLSSESTTEDRSR
jgi:hypothetical protein